MHTHSESCKFWFQNVEKQEDENWTPLEFFDTIFSHSNEMWYRNETLRSKHLHIKNSHSHRLTDVHRFKYNHKRRITHDHIEYVQFFGTGFFVRTLATLDLIGYISRTLNSLWTNENSENRSSASCT